MDDMKHQMRQHFLQYASYVIRDRAIPDVIDGLKPVQRRILQILWQMHDGKLHKVANVAGQTMSLHPHGEAAIVDALVNLATKEFLLDQQGNFGNIFTGDPAAAGRYIETRLSALAEQTLFNPDLTEFVLSYDSRHKEPVRLPAKIPVLLMQGVSGIAVGMSTYIFPHNFVELLEAEIAILEGREYNILPDFPTGGIMDASEYNKGRGKIKLRTKMEVRDPKTIVITEICYSTTTESLIKSIDDAAKRGKIKIESINDYTSDKVEIEIKLPRGQYAEELITALYGFTECEISLNSQIVVIKDEMPWEPDVNQILELNVQKLQEYLHRELELERDRLNEKIFEKSLEQIFIENRMYKKIENLSAYDEIHKTIATSLEPFHPELIRIPTYDDREKLLNIPIRRISRFDLDKNKEEIVALQQSLGKVLKDLKQIKKVAVSYLQGLIKKYGKEHARKTKIEQIEQVDKRAIATKGIKVGFDPATGFVGTKVSSEHTFECTNFDKLLLLFKDGSYQVMNIPEKQYVHHDENKVIYAGPADKKTVMNIVYKDPKTKYCFIKRFIVDKFILDKKYRYFDEGMELQVLTTNADSKIELQFIPKPNQKVSHLFFNFNEYLVKGVSAKGVRAADKAVKKVIIQKTKPQPDLFENR
jgi:topoisomerase-4 subunit A